MKRSISWVLVVAALSSPAFAQEGGGEVSGPAQPEGTAPTQVPPAPEAAPAPPPDAPAMATPTAPAPQAEAPTTGQWVYTAQYGWVYEPYNQQYTYVPADGQTYPYQYVYYPVYGWRWVVAPWVYGYGPQPYWGVYGPRYYVWYSHPWYQRGGYYGWGGYHSWGQYHGWVGPRNWGSRGWAQAPAYYRTGAVNEGVHGAAPAGVQSHGAVAAEHPAQGAAPQIHETGAPAGAHPLAAPAHGTSNPAPTVAPHPHPVAAPPPRRGASPGRHRR